MNARSLAGTSLLLAVALLLIAGSGSAQEDPRWPQWPSGPSYQSDFGGPEIFSDWAITSGVWEVRNGVLRQSAPGASRIATVPSYTSGIFPDMGHNYFMDLYVSIRSTGADARAGVVFDFADPGNFHEALFSASGAVQLRTRLNNVTTTVATGTFRAPGVNNWTHIRIERGHSMTTVKMDGVVVIRAIQSDLAPGDIGLITSAAVAQFEDLKARTLSMVDPPGATYTEDFDDLFADFWAVERGVWTAASGEYRSTAVGSADLALSDIAQIVLNNGDRDVMYSLKTRMLNGYRGSGNLMGLLLDYGDRDNYREIVFSPTGQAHLRVVEQGVLRTLETRPYVGGGQNTWFEVELVQRRPELGPSTGYVKVNGRVVFGNVAFGIFRGFVTHWTQGRFDDVRASQQIFQSSFLPFDDGQIFDPGWQLQNGTLNGYAIQASSPFLFAYTWHEMHDISVRAWIQNHYASSGNRAGLVYGARENHFANAVDNYYEVVFSPTGVAYLNRVFHGQVMNVASAAYQGGGAHRWFNVQLIRRNRYTTVIVNGATVFSQIYQPDASGEFVGVVTHWTDANFDDVQVTELQQ
jgi:hypothetical protein